MDCVEVFLGFLDNHCESTKKSGRISFGVFQQKQMQCWFGASSICFDRQKNHLQPPNTGAKHQLFAGPEQRT